MKAKRTRTSGTRRRLSLAICVAAIVVTLPAGCATLRFWRAVPKIAVQARFFPRAEQQAAYRRALRSPQAVAAYRFLQASRALTAAAMGRATPAQLETQLDQVLAGTTASQLGRLQRAAARLWELHQAGAPPDQRWTAVRPYLEGIERGDFAHLLDDLLAALTREYGAAGLGPGTACTLAQWAVGHDHGPFLQRFVGDLDEMIAQRRHAGDTAAARTCRTVRNRLLRQWVLDPGPPTLRLLAADLLADTLERDGAPREQAQAIAANLRQWRNRYRAEIARRPLDVLAAYQKPALAPRASQTLTTRAALTVWLAVALAVAALLTIGLAPWLFRAIAPPNDRRMFLAGAAAAIVVAVGGILWIALRPDLIRADFRADCSALRYCPVSPLVAALLVLVLIAVASRLTRKTAGGRAHRLGAVAAGTWLMLAVTLWGAAIAAEAARRDYERATAAACNAPLAALLGETQATSLLAPLRAWQP